MLSFLSLVIVLHLEKYKATSVDYFLKMERLAGQEKAYFDPQSNISVLSPALLVLQCFVLKTPPSPCISHLSLQALKDYSSMVWLQGNNDDLDIFHMIHFSIRGT